MGKIIVSYDGTPNDDDALALGKLLARSGATLALAYVRHSQELDPRREEIAAHDARKRLDQGAAWLEQPDVSQHVVVSASTGEGLAQLAAAEDAALIVFGSDYRTAPGRVEPGTTAQHLLEGGSIAVAVAPAGLRATSNGAIHTIAPFPDDSDPATRMTVQALAEKLGAQVLGADSREADLIVAGSQPGASEGRIALGGTTRVQLSLARSSVIVLPRGKPVRL